jgi:sortase family protein
MTRKGRAERTAATARQDERPGAWRQVIGLAGMLFVIGGGSVLGVAAGAQQHAPQPAPSAAGTIGPGSGEPSLPRSDPVSIDIPAIGVQSNLLRLGLNPNGSLQVPPLYARPSRAGWYKYSPTPGQTGSSVIEGHIDTYRGPSVFFRLGALRPGNQVDVTLANGTVAVFKVTGVRSYPKTSWPWHVVFGSGDYPALHLITCGGTFDYSTRQYLSNIVVFASLISSKTAASTHG